MSSKDVWRWLIPRFSNEHLVDIYTDQNIQFKGIRTNKIKNFINKANRNMLISNLFEPKNYQKLLLWSKTHEPTQLEGLSLVDKEINELVSIAENSDVATVFTKLFFEDQEKKAIQLYALLKDEQSELLNVPHEYFVFKSENTESDDKKPITKQKTISNEKPKEETTTSKKDQKKIQQLEQKVDNLKKELEKRDEIHKKKVDELIEKHKNTHEKLTEKNRLYNELVKENEKMTEYTGGTGKWNKEKAALEETIKDLQGKLNHLHAQQMKDKQLHEKQLQELSKEGSDNKATTEIAATLNQTKKTRIIVIGKPVYTNLFDNEKIEFKFVEAGTVHDYQFPLDCESYWVLSYELDNKDQFLLNANDSYSQIDKTKINICKNFNQVKELLNQNNRIRERVL
ncbi:MULTISPECIES: hypothetical protein [Bacillus cereus group]|uniref:Uncharacterized protein n=1 Tax=Bacillus thuringiensis TaxID=1428 RepID=A0A9X6WIY9_BACTU|nr:MULTISPECIES: hypothetical protein [Bacillus cereus group]PFJ31824.1 hypothetical protein COJ15_29425 [Bacillus thuringiensis]PGP12604.1 hypothetical protein COA01_32835 [Bacillus cereus]